VAAYDLTTVDAIKETITLPDSNDNLDAIIPTLISQASKAIMHWCKREFAPSATATRRFKVDSYHIDLSPYDLQSVTTVVLHPEQSSPQTLTSGYYMLKPIGAERGVYTSIDLSQYLAITSQTMMMFGYALMDITGTWGFASVPDDVVRACNITVGSWLTRSAPAGSGTYGVPANAAMGATLFRNDWAIPWAARNLLGPFKRGSSRWPVV